MKRIQPPAIPRKPHVAGVADLPLLLDMSCDEHDAADESNKSSDLSGTEGKPPISPKQTEFSLKQFANRMGQPNFSLSNKWHKVWMAGCLEKRHRSIMCGQN
jgi:hypothetical protein